MDSASTGYSQYVRVDISDHFSKWNFCVDRGQTTHSAVVTVVSSDRCENSQLNNKNTNSIRKLLLLLIINLWWST